MTKDKAMIGIRLEQQSMGNLWPCVICGEYHKMPREGAVVTYYGRGQVGIICGTCLLAGREHAQSRAEGHADDLRKEANQFEEVAQQVADVAWPSYDDLRAFAEEIEDAQLKAYHDWKKENE